MDDLRLALSFHPYYTYEAWHAAKEIPEAALLAAEKDIRAGRVRKLEALRDQEDKLNYAMPMLGETYGRYMRLLNNLSCLFWVWAHQAKHFNSFAAAKPVVDEAMRVCGVNGSENKRTFTSVMLTKDPSDCLEAIMTFESEIRQGEHAKAKNLAAILTKRLKALP